MKQYQFLAFMIRVSNTPENIFWKNVNPIIALRTARLCATVFHFDHAFHRSFFVYATAESSSRTKADKISTKRTKLSTVRMNMQKIIAEALGRIQWTRYWSCKKTLLGEKRPDKYTKRYIGVCYLRGPSITVSSTSSEINLAKALKKQLTKHQAIFMHAFTCR